MVYDDIKLKLLTELIDDDSLGNNKKFKTKSGGFDSTWFPYDHD